MKLNHIKCLLVVFLILNCNYLISSEINELEKRLNLTNGMPKIQLLNNLAEEYLDIDIPKSLFYAKEGYKLSLNSHNDTFQLHFVYNISIANYYLGNYQLCLNNIEEGLKISKRKNDEQFYLDLLTIKGSALRAINQVDNSIKTLNSAFLLAEKLKNKSKQADILNNIGNIYDAIGDYENATDHFLKSLRYRNVKTDSMEIALTYNNIGNMYQKLENYVQAIEFFQTANKFSNETTLNEQALIMNNLGAANYSANRFDEALKCLNDALKLRNNLRDQRNVASIFNNLGELYRRQNKLELAIVNYKKALEIYTKYNNDFGLSIVNLNLAKLNMQISQLKSAFENLNISSQIIEKHNFKVLKLELYEKFSEYYKLSGDLAKTILYKDKYIKLKDSLSNIDRNRKLNALFSQFLIEDKEKQIDNFKVTQKLLDLELYKKNILNILLGVLGTCFIIIIAIVTNRIRLKNKYEKDLLHKNLDLEHLKSDLEIKNESLSDIKNDLEESLNKVKSLNESSNNIIAIVSHEYKTPLQFIQTSNALVVAKIMSGDLTGAIEQSNRAELAILKMRFLLEHYNNVKGLVDSVINISLENFELSTYLKDLVTNYFSLMDNEHNYVVNIENKEPVEILITPIVIDHILYNMVSNAQKYATAFTTINISMFADEKVVKFTIENEGQGIPKSEQNKLYQLYHRFSNAEPGKGVGVGLYLVKKVIDEIKGTIELESDTNQGAKFTITIPLVTEASIIVVKNVENDNSKEKENINNTEAIVTQ